MDVQVLPSSMKFPILGSVASFLTRRSIVKVRAGTSGGLFFGGNCGGSVARVRLVKKYILCTNCVHF